MGVFDCCAIAGTAANVALANKRAVNLRIVFVSLDTFGARAIGAASGGFMRLSCDFDSSYKSEMFRLSLATITPSNKSYIYMTILLHQCHITVT